MIDDYIKSHTNQAAYNTWKTGSSHITPNVSLIDDTHTVIYEPLVPTQTQE